MDRIRVCSRCGGGNYPVKAIRVEADCGGFREVGKREGVSEADADVHFEETKAQRWRLYFKAGENGQVVIRGLRFFSSRGEIFCQNYPTYLMNEDK